MTDEDKRFDKHSFEMPVMLHNLKLYLKPGNRIFDVARRTERIAGRLLEPGYYTGLNDLTDKNIRVVK